MKLKYLLWTLPLLAAAEFYAFSGITYLLRQPADAAVLAGLVSVCVLIIFNFYLIRLLILKTKIK